MSQKDGLDNSLRKDGESQKKKKPFSKAYHGFFEGYSEVTVPKPGGMGYSIQRIYTGDYYRQELDKSQRILLRVLYVVLFLVAAYLFGSSAAKPLSSNSTWYVALIQMANLALLAWIIIVFVSYLPTGKDLTIGEYRRGPLSLRKSALFSAIGLGMTALAVLIFVLLNRPDESLLELLNAGKYLVAGLTMFSMNQVENRVKYLIIPSQNVPPPDAVEIS